MKLAAAASLLLLGCGGPVHTAPGASGCPSANEVAYALWAPRTVVGTPTPGVPREGAWLVRLGFVPEDADAAPGPGAIEGYEVAKLGLGPLPAQVWLLRDGVATCAARVAGYAAIPGDGARSIAAILTGCPGGDPHDPYASGWISFAGAEPTGCRLVTPARATPGGELPEAWSAAAPAEPCDDCERTWATDAIAGSPAIDAVTVTDRGGVAVGCSDATHDGYAIYATPTDGAATPVAIDPALTLAGALVDPRGTRAVLAVGVDTWATADVAAGIVGGRSVQWFDAGPASGPRHTLADTCDAD